MMNIKLLSVMLMLLFIAMGCASPNALTSDEMTHVAGVVVDSESFDRVANAQIRFMNDDITVNTESNGTFTARDVTVGTHTVTIEADGYGTVEQSVEIVNGGSRLQIKLDR
jgi:hypothetical protein